MFWYLMLISLICVDFSLESFLRKKGFFDDKIKNSTLKRVLIFIFNYRIITILTLVFMSTFKAISCGSDTWFYRDYYNDIKSGTNKPFVNSCYNTLEYGFVFLNSLLAIMNLPFKVFLLIVSTFVSITIVLFVNKVSSNKIMSILMYVALGFFAQSLSAYRQIIAFAFVLIAFMRLVDKKYISSASLIMVAMTFHVSAIVCLIAIPLRIIKPKLWMILGLFGIVVLGAFLFPEILKFIELYTPINYYTKYYVRLTQFIVESDLLNTLYSLALLAVFMVLLIVRFKWLKLEDKDKQIYDFFLWLYMLVPMFRIAGMIIKMPQLLHRLNVYFFVSLVILIPLFIKGLNYNKKLYVVLNVSTYVVIVLYMVYLYAIKNTCGVYPFVFGF